MPVSPKIISGRVDRVPCPHCGRPNDFTEPMSNKIIEGRDESARDEGGPGNPGTAVVCDHCHRYMEVVKVGEVTVVSVRQHPDHGSNVAPAPEVPGQPPQVRPRAPQVQQKKPAGVMGRVLDTILGPPRQGRR
jgi:hypothetical protein